MVRHFLYDIAILIDQAALKIMVIILVGLLAAGVLRNVV